MEEVRSMMRARYQTTILADLFGLSSDNHYTAMLPKTKFYLKYVAQGGIRSACLPFSLLAVACLGRALLMAALRSQGSRS